MVPIHGTVKIRGMTTIERDVDGDPTDVILRDRILLCMVALFAVILFVLLYL